MFDIGPWWWSSGQHACLLLRRFEFESKWSIKFFCKFVVDKYENEQKETGFDDTDHKLSDLAQTSS